MPMIRTSFAALCDGFVDGDSLTHRLSNHEESNCFSWQQGAREFAAHLDKRESDRANVAPQDLERERMRAFYFSLGVECGWGRDKSSGEYLAPFARDAWAAWQEAKKET